MTLINDRLKFRRAIAAQRNISKFIENKAGHVPTEVKAKPKKRDNYRTPEDIVAAVQAMLAESCYTQKQIANIYAISVTTVNRISTGEYHRRKASVRK